MNTQITEADSPRLHVSFLGREYVGKSGAQSFEIRSDVTNIYDGWTLDLTVGPDGVNEDLMSLGPNRWIPIVLSHSDPAVNAGAPVPVLEGVCVDAEHSCSGDASTLRLSGYDLGKLLDSGAQPWKRIRGNTLEGLIVGLLDRSWQAKYRTDGWGFKGVRGLNGDVFRKQGKRISSSAFVRQDIGRNPLAFMPPIQIEVGETCYDIINRYARLTGATQSSGSFVTVSSDGWIQVFNPDDSSQQEPSFTLEDHLDQRNQRIKRSTLKLSGEDIYSDYRCYGSVIRPPGVTPYDNQHPNAGRFFREQVLAGALGTSQNPLFRRLSFADGEQYKGNFAKARVNWRLNQSRYKELALMYTLQGHSYPGPDGKPLPIVEGNIVEVNSSRHRIYERMLIESVTKRQNASVGTECDITLRRLGLLGA